MNGSTAGFPVLHSLPEFAQAHVHWVGDVIQKLILSSPSPPALNLSQHQGLFQWASSLHQVAKVLELQLQHQPFQWIFRFANDITLMAQSEEELKSLFFNLFFNWRIIGLQNFVLCQTSTWISHRYTYIPSLLNFPPISLPMHPSSWYRVSVWVS